MKKTFDKTEFDHLIATKQYFVAVWRLINDDGIDDVETVTKVSEVVAKAAKDNCIEQLSKIMRQFSRWVNDGASASAHTILNETTAVDLQPDEL